MKLTHDGVDEPTTPHVSARQLQQELEQLGDLFRQNDSRVPLVMWTPGPRDLKAPLVRQFAARIAELPQHNDLIRQAGFDMHQFADLLDWMLLVDVENQGATFRYSHYGDGIAKVLGQSMLGQTTDAFDGHISQFFNTIYRSVLALELSVLTRHEPPKQVFATEWERLIVPLTDADDKVVQFVVLNVPDNELRPGLEVFPEPVLIADENQIVRFANRAAREIFEHSAAAMPGARMDLFAFAGIDLEIPQTPDELVQSHAIHDVVSLVLCGTLIQRFVLTISATMQRGHAFYVITLRPTFDPIAD